MGKTEFFAEYINPFLEKLTEFYDDVCYIARSGYLVLYVCATPIVFFLISIFLVECFLFFLIYVWIISFKVIFKSYYVGSSYNGFLSENTTLYNYPIILFLIRFLLYFPKLIGFRYAYSTVKMFMEKKFQTFTWYPVYFLIFILLPFRILVKTVTGVSFISLRVNALLFYKFITLKKHKFENQWELIYTWCDNVAIYYYVDYYYYSSTIRINFKEDSIIFNPGENVKKAVFSQLDFFKKHTNSSTKFSNDLIECFRKHDKCCNIINLMVGKSNTPHVASIINLNENKSVFTNRTHSSTLPVTNEKNEIEYKSNFILNPEAYNKVGWDYTTSPAIIDVNKIEMLSKSLPTQLRDPITLALIKQSNFNSFLINLNSETIYYNNFSKKLEIWANEAGAKQKLINYIKSEINLMSEDSLLHNYYRSQIHIFENHKHLWEDKELFETLKFLFEFSFTDLNNNNINLDLNLVEKSFHLKKQETLDIVRSNVNIINDLF